MLINTLLFSLKKTNKYFYCIFYLEKRSGELISIGRDFAYLCRSRSLNPGHLTSRYLSTVCPNFFGLKATLKQS